MSDQPSLFDDPEPDAYAKRNDPETSWAAADALEVDTLRVRLKAVYDCLVKFGPCHNDGLVRQYQARSGNPAYEGYPPQTDQSIRSRRAELTARGLCMDTGQRVVLPTGRKAVVWSATRTG